MLVDALSIFFLSFVIAWSVEGLILELLLPKGVALPISHVPSERKTTGPRFQVPPDVSRRPLPPGASDTSSSPPDRGSARHFLEEPLRLQTCENPEQDENQPVTNMLQTSN